MFLPLDDILEEGKHIDMIDMELSTRQGRNGRRSSAGPDDGFSHGGDREVRGSMGDGSVSDISRPPMFLMEQDYGNSFKMSTCAVDQVSYIRCAESTIWRVSGLFYRWYLVL